MATEMKRYSVPVAETQGILCSCGQAASEIIVESVGRVSEIVDAKCEGMS